MEAHPSLIAAKSAFLNTQIRLLSTILTPSTQALSQVAAYDDGPSARVIEEVVYKVNAKIKAHNERVYTPETTRHVASQIEALYWNEVTAMPRPGEGDETLVERRKDLADPETIATLPPNFSDTFLKSAPSSSPPSSPSASSASPSQQYTTLLSRLLTLSQTLATEKQRLAQYEHLSSLVQPLKNPIEDIQPNLASKGGELERELERMRVLAARVKSGVERREGRGPEEGKWEGDGRVQVPAKGEKEREKLEGVLGLLDDVPPPDSDSDSHG